MQVSRWERTVRACFICRHPVPAARISPAKYLFKTKQKAPDKQTNKPQTNKLLPWALLLPQVVGKQMSHCGGQQGHWAFSTQQHENSQKHGATDWKIKTIKGMDTGRSPQSPPYIKKHSKAAQQDSCLVSCPRYPLSITQLFSTLQIPSVLLRNTGQILFLLGQFKSPTEGRTFR